MLDRDFLFYLDGVSCAECGIVLQKPITFSSAKPDVEMISIPGRNGDLCFSNGSFSNVQGTATCYALDDRNVTNKLSNLSAWLFRTQNYRRLELTQDPECYRLARVSSGPKNEVRMNLLAPFAIIFDCKPQKWLKVGERLINITTSGQLLHNPGQLALPLIIVYGSGTGAITVGGITVQIKSLDGSLTIDCDLQDAYKGTQNKNSTILAPEFPTLPPGSSVVTWTGGVSRVEIIPRWWTL